MSNEFYNWELASRASKNFAKACSLLVGNKLISLQDLLDHIPHSACVRNIRRCVPSYTYASSMSMALMLLSEMGKETSERVRGVLLRPQAMHPFTEWLTRTEMLVSIQLNTPIEQLRLHISSDELQNLYGLYHVYYDVDVIIREQYEPALGISKGNCDG